MRLFVICYREGVRMSVTQYSDEARLNRAKSAWVGLFESRTAQVFTDRTNSLTEADVAALVGQFVEGPSNGLLRGNPTKS